MSVIHREALVTYSAARMYGLVADIPSYPQFLPWCGSTKVLTQDEDSVTASIEIVYGAVHKSFTTRNLLRPGKMMEIQLLDGPFSHLQGFWHFHALDEAACKVTLDLDFEVANRLVGLVLTPVFTNIANQLVDCFRQRADQLYGAIRS
jgi:ribosome-associated toxin RatA of RatAB toxin-antitoxin module